VKIVCLFVCLFVCCLLFVVVFALTYLNVVRVDLLLEYGANVNIVDDFFGTNKTIFCFESFH
jgi:hypothetical protein